MNAKRREILTGMAGGAIWAGLVVGLPQWAGLAYIPAPIALPGAMVGPGLVMLVMVGRLAQRRFFDETIIDGEAFVPGSPAEIDQRVLTNTTEQVVLAVALWPFVAVTLGGAVVLSMGLAFAVARFLFWAGYHRSPPLRGFGFAATFYPTILATFWALATWVL